jgi:hypothetical protein
MQEVSVMDGGAFLLLQQGGAMSLQQVGNHLGYGLGEGFKL